MTLPLVWRAGDRARWNDRDVVVEYTADDGALISYRREGDKRDRYAIVSLSALSLRLPN